MNETEDKGQYRYEAWVDTRRFRWWGGDDRQARRKVARWIRFWSRHVDLCRAGITIGGGTPVCIQRIWCEIPGIIPYVKATCVERFDLDAETFAGFARIAKTSPEGARLPSPRS